MERILPAQTGIGRVERGMVQQEKRQGDERAKEMGMDVDGLVVEV